MSLRAAVLYLMLTLGLFRPSPVSAFMGTELGPLIQLVAGQIKELETLAQSIGVARDQMKMLQEVNDGINRTLGQIQNIQSVVERAKGLDPTQVRSLADLNDLFSRAKQTKSQVDQILKARISLTNEAIAQSALQGDTTYKMGQEMVAVGSGYSDESKSASPGRASQITAGAASAQTVATGVELQTLSQLLQLQALSLEYQKAQAERELRESQLRQVYFEAQVDSQIQGGSDPKRKRMP